MAQNWNIDPKNGDYVMVNGAPQQTDSLTVPAYIRLRGHRTRWMYAPDNQWGSDFWRLTKRQSTRDSSDIENKASRALRPIVDSGRAVSIGIETTAVNRGGVGLEVVITTPDEKQNELTIPSLGV